MKLTIGNVRLMAEAGARRIDVLRATGCNLTQLNKLLRDNAYKSFSELQKFAISVNIAVQKPIADKFMLVDVALTDDITKKLAADYGLNPDTLDWHRGTGYALGTTIYGGYGVLLTNGQLLVELVKKGDRENGICAIFELPKCWLPKIYDVAMIPSNVAMRLMGLVK